MTLEELINLCLKTDSFETHEMAVLVNVLPPSESSPRVAQQDAYVAEMALQAHSMLGLFLVRGQKDLCLMKMGEQGKTLSSPFTDELQLVAQPVGLQR